MVKLTHFLLRPLEVREIRRNFFNISKEPPAHFKPAKFQLKLHKVADDGRIVTSSQNRSASGNFHRRILQLTSLMREHGSALELLSSKENPTVLVAEDGSFVLLTTLSCVDEKVPPNRVSSTHWDSHSPDKHRPDRCGDVICLLANGAPAQTFTLHRLGSDLYPLSRGHVQQKSLLFAC